MLVASRRICWSYRECPGLASGIYQPYRMNWLDPPAEPPNVAPEMDKEAPSEHTLNYWAARLTPLHDPAPGYFAAPSDVEGGKDVVFVGCNRVGTEEGRPPLFPHSSLCPRAEAWPRMSRRGVVRVAAGTILIGRYYFRRDKLRHDHVFCTFTDRIGRML
jgi:hypothetical protein